MSLEEITAAGLMVIGLPLLSSCRPSARTDADFGMTALGNLKQAFDVARERDLVVLIPGGLFDNWREPDLRIMVRAMRILKSSRQPVFLLVGESDKPRAGAPLESTPVAVMRECAQVRVIDRSCAVAILRLGAPERKTVMRLGGTPYGMAVPRDVRPYFGKSPSGFTLWLTHHNWDFGGGRPDALQMREIQGCNLVVSGLLPATLPVERAGITSFLNPGTMLRRTADLLDHEECVWLWAPGEDGNMKLRKHVLSFKRDMINPAADLFSSGEDRRDPPAVQPSDRVADMSVDKSAERKGGRSVSRGSKPQSPKISASLGSRRVPGQIETVFAQILQDELSDPAGKDGEAAPLLEDMEALFEKMNTPPELRALLLDARSRSLVA